MNSFVKGMGRYNLQPSSSRRNKRGHVGALQGVSRAFLRTGDNMWRAIIEVDSKIPPLSKKIRIVAMDKETADSLKEVKFIRMPNGEICIAKNEKVEFLYGVSRG